MKQRLLPALMVLLFAIAPACAQDWPTKNVRFIVPFGAGATPDIIARLVADHIQQKHSGIAVVVENKPGASGNIGTDAVAKAAPDGTTIGVSILGPLALNTLLFAKMPYDPFKDLAPITVMVTQPSVLVVNGALPVKNVAELVELIRREPDKYNFGSIGNGSLSHLAMEAIAIKSGVKLVHIPYSSSPQAMTALVRGDVHMACLPAISVTPHVASGKVKILAVSTAQRSKFLPEIPTLKEAGIPDVEASAWTGLVAPAGVPDAVIAKINAAVVEALFSPSVREKLAAQMMEPVGNSPAEMKAHIAAEMVRWAPIVKAAGLKPN